MNVAGLACERCGAERWDLSLPAPFGVPLMTMGALPLLAAIAIIRAMRKKKQQQQDEGWQDAAQAAQEMTPEQRRLALPPGLARQMLQFAGTQARCGMCGHQGALPISSPWGWRIHPLTGRPKMHAGIDIPLPEGTPVYAPAAGVIIRVDVEGDGENEAHGNGIKLVAYDGTVFLLLHLSAVDVRQGQHVRGGQEIGKSGASGPVTGPHLHFAIYDAAGQSVNPIAVYPPGTFREVS